MDDSIDYLLTYGRPHVFTGTLTSPGAGSNSVVIRPASANKLWVISTMWAWQESGGARTCVFQMLDPVTTWTNMETPTSIGSGVHRFLPDAGAPMLRFPSMGLVCRYTRYFRFNWTALGAGEVAYAYALALEVDLI